MNKIAYIFIFLFIFSCNTEKTKKPNNFIEKDKMIDLIIDMKIAEKARTIQNKKKKKNLNYMAVVFEKHQIDSTQFKDNNAYYTDNIELYYEIYQTIQTRLKDSVSKYENLKKITDSLKRAENKKKLELNKQKKKLPINFKDKIKTVNKK